MDSISLNSGERLRREAELSHQRSQTRTERSWKAVGDALSNEVNLYHERLTGQQ